MRCVGSVEDRLLIRELYGYYSDVSSRADKQGWLSCWTEDCHWKSSFFENNGKQAMSEQWDTLWADFEIMGFLSNISFIKVDGDTAKARAVTQEWIKLSEGSTQRLMGYYEDELRRVDGVWLFASRHYVNTAFESY